MIRRLRTIALSGMLGLAVFPLGVHARSVPHCMTLLCARPTASDTGFVGRWEGVYHSEHAPDGKIAITLTIDSTTHALSAAMELPVVPVGAASGVRADSTHIVWKQQVSGSTCDVSADRADNGMKGALTCEFGRITFEVRRSGNSTDAYEHPSTQSRTSQCGDERLR